MAGREPSEGCRAKAAAQPFQAKGASPMTNDDRNPNLMKNRYVFGLTGASLAGLTGASIVGPVGAIVGAILGFLVGFNMLKRF